MSWRLTTLPAASAVALVTILGTLAVASGVSRAQRHVPGSDAAFPKVKYADSLVSPNDRCIVAGKKLNPKVRPVYVSGVPIGFC